MSLRPPSRFCGGKFTLVLLHFNQSIVFSDVVGSVSALRTKPFLGFTIPSNVLVFHKMKARSRIDEIELIV